MATPVYLEVGSKRVFACAVEWPGWARVGKDEASALEALAAYAPRYAPVAAEAGVKFPARAAASFDVVERVPGSGTTDFGALGSIAEVDRQAVTPKEAARLADVVAASWTILERVAAGAPAELKKGPRGGGRDRDEIVRHVADAEVAYARKMAIRARQDEDLRQLILEGLRNASTMQVGEKGWPPRYGARRIAWHVLDHAWEIEDKSGI